jgi:hypothetical protein
VCISASKEKDIEAKLKSVINDWSAQEFKYANFKSRGELLLKGLPSPTVFDVLYVFVCVKTDSVASALFHTSGSFKRSDLATPSDWETGKPGTNESFH